MPRDAEKRAQDMQDFRLPSDSLLITAEAFPGPAPVHLWQPPYCGDSDMRIARDGRWYHQGNLIRRPRLVQAFSRLLRREEDGSFSLVTPVERVGITVEDCPFVATLVDVVDAGEGQRLEFTLNTGERLCAGPDHAIIVEQREGAPHPVLQVRRGLDALISRNAFYRLVEVAELRVGPEGEQVQVCSAGHRFTLGAC